MGYIYPDCDLRRWSYCDNSVILANADDYYTKKEVEDLIDDVSGMSPSEVQNMINDSIRTKADKSEVNELATQVSGKAENSAVTEVNNTITAHTANTSIHVTVADKTAWNAKLDAADVENFFGAVNYDSNSKRINFYNTSTGGTVLAYVDATDFVKDGFLQSVTIENKTIDGQSVPCLVFIWNIDSRIQETDIPLTDIFNPDNFYDKTEIDTIVSGINEDISAVSGDVATKQNTLTAGDGIQITNDVISVTGIPNVDQTVISGSTNPVAGGAVYTELQGKQATLVNQTNIKSINNESLLGSGNISTLQASVSGSTLILS